MLGEVGNDATIINADKEAVAKAVVAAALEESGYESTAAAKDAGVAYVLMGHGTAHVAKVTYSQMATQMDKLGYENVFIGTVEGEEASPDYFGLDTGDASKDDPRNQDEIGEKELLVVSFGTSFNDSRVADIKSIEDALQAANPDWSVRRAFTAQIIINHIQARDGEKIDNMEQALERAVANGVKQLVVQPTHLMHGAEYDEMCAAIDKVRDKFESVEIAEPMLGEVGNDATVINADKEAVAKAVVAAALSESGYESTAAAKEAGVAYVLMGHGTAHVAKVTYSQMAAQMDKLGYENVFIGTVEGEPEDTSCEAVIAAVKEAGYTTVVLRPLMVVAGDHANNDMAGADEDSWKTMFEAAGFTVNCQISGLGRIADVQALYVAHTKAAIDAIA